MERSHQDIDPGLNPELENSIMTSSGRWFSFTDPKPEQFTLKDIAKALSRICRFGGHGDRFYSVAEHLVLCAGLAVDRKVPPRGARAVLMHDAAEAFTGDTVRPLKVMLRDYKTVEWRIEKVIAAKYDVSFDVWSSVIKAIDRDMLMAERNLLFSNRDGSVRWTGEDGSNPPTLPPELFGWPPPEAEHEFLMAARNHGFDTETM